MAVVTVTIPAGQSLSDVINLTGNQQIEGILTPPAWDPAPLSLQASMDGTTYYAVSASTTTDVLLMPIAVNQWIPTATRDFPRGVNMKIQSGHPFAPVAQSADRIFQLVVF